MTGSLQPARVCLVAPRWAPRFSGAALRFRQYLPGLRERGLAVDVLCSTAPSEDATTYASIWANLEFGETLRTEEAEGTAVTRVKLPAKRSLRRNMLFRSAILRHVRKTPTDVVQFLTLEPLRTYRGSGLARMGVAGVFTGTQLSTFSANPLKRMLQRRWVRVPIDRLEHMIVSSAVMCAFYDSLGVTTPISVIPNGVDLQRFCPSDRARERASSREALGIAQTADVVLFVGSIIYRKGVDVLINAFARVAETNPRAELVLVGPRDAGDSEKTRAYDARVDELVRKSGASDRIRFAGFVSNVDAFLRAADVLVLPSRREGMGNVVLEAMASGIPTVLSHYLGLPDEFGVPGTHYLLSEPGADSLASNIDSLLNDAVRRRTIAKAGRLWVEEHMDMVGVVDAYARVYHDLAAHGVVRPPNRTLSWIQ